MILLATLISAEISKCFKTVNKIHRSDAPDKKKLILPYILPN